MLKVLLSVLFALWFAHPVTIPYSIYVFIRLLGGSTKSGSVLKMFTSFLYSRHLMLSWAQIRDGGY